MHLRYHTAIAIASLMLMKNQFNRLLFIGIPVTERAIFLSSNNKSRG